MDMAKTPRGFRDCLPAQAAWRSEITAYARSLFASWGYLPVETPVVEFADTIKACGQSDTALFQFFDSDNNLLVLRPDVTVQVARLVGTRIAQSSQAKRLYYAQHVFSDKESNYAPDREFTQLGVELIGECGVAADAELLCMLCELISGVGVKDFTVAIGTAALPTTLVKKASADLEWRSEIFTALHRSDMVALDRLVYDERAQQDCACVLSKLARLQGGKEVFDECRKLVKPYGCADSLALLEQSFELASAYLGTGKLMVDFSIVSSFDYYTGLVFKAYAPCVPASLASGGRYDRTLKIFGSDAAAAGFALGLERVMAAAAAQGAKQSPFEPEEVVADEDVFKRFSRARRLRAAGKRVVLSGGDF